MKFFADFHFHSKHSRATSKKADLESLNKWAEKKGLRVIGTSDFTHPKWFKELKDKLKLSESGLYCLKEGEDTRFILSSEISCIYSKKDKTRKIHIIILAPDFKTVEEINTRLGWEGKLESDGRPILGMDAKELAKIVLSASEDCLLIPAHIWTPWFSLFGSRSGFDSIEECFEEYSDYIYAVETGLSSNPPMNWRLSTLDDITLISNSDAHSPKKLGREANIFEGEELNYKNLTEAIKVGAKAKKSDPLRLIQTIEFYPQEGRYYYDGHRKCDVKTHPEKSKEYNNICPACGKPLTIGVLNRVEELADREEDYKPDNAISFKSLIPLEEIIAEALDQGTGTKGVMKEYDNLIEKLGSEFEVLLESSKSDLKKIAGPKIAEGIVKVRNEEVNISPGYDGVHGKVNIFSEKEQEKIPGQETLF